MDEEIYGPVRPPGWQQNNQNGMGSLYDLIRSLGGGGGKSPFEYTPWGSGTGEATGFGYIGANAPAFGAVAQGIGQLAGIYTGIKQLGLAKDQFRFQKRAYNTNLRNSTQSYNTQVADRINGRSYATQAERDAALKAAMLSTEG